jgi:hypothetical protein
MKNCWKTLGIAPTNNLDAIKNARRMLVKTWHPDLAPTEPAKEAATNRCAEINAAFDEAISRLKSLANRPPTVHSAELTTSHESPSFARAFLSNPLVWFSASTALIATNTIPIPVAVPGTLLYGFAAIAALAFSRNMLHNCAPNQRSNWLLLVVASAVVLFLSLHDVSSRVFGPLPAHVTVIAGVLVLPFWILGFRTSDRQ